MTRKDEYEALREELNQTPDALEGTTGRCLARARRQRRALRWKFPSMAAAAFLIVFITLSNTSVAFAHAIGEVPVLGELASFVTFDPSLKAAVENKYVQPVGLSETKSGITLSIAYVIADRQRMVVFYTLNSESEDLEELRLEVKCGDAFEYSSTTAWYPDIDEGLRSFTLDFPNADLPDHLLLELELVKETADSSDRSDNMDEPPVFRRETLAAYSFPLHLNYVADAQVFTPDEKITIDGQQITIQTVEVFPTVTKVTIQADPENTAILRGIGMSLKDNKGRVWSGSTGLVSRSDSTGSLFEFFMESNYFSGAGHLTLSVDSVSFLPESERTVTVDVESGTASPLPDSMRLLKLEQRGDRVFLTFSKRDHGNSVSIFTGSYTDESGSSYYFGYSTYTTNDSEDGAMQESTQSFAIEHFEGGRIYLERSWTPSDTLETPIEIKLR